MEKVVIIFLVGAGLLTLGAVVDALINNWNRS